MSAPIEVTVTDLSAAAAGAASIAGATHIGPVRTENQDDLAATAIASGGVAILLADGMGGLPGGGEAARVAIAAAREVLAAGSVDAVADAMQAANAAVAELRAQIHGQPGTTLTIAAVAGGTAVIGHAGDSRAYLVRGGEARVLTTDHSWVGDQVRAGELPPGAERRHPRRNVITMAVLGDELHPQLQSLALLSGDVLMLCSDGFWEPLPDEMIAELMALDGPLTAVVERAARSALEAGASDNVSLVALRLGA